MIRDGLLNFCGTSQGATGGISSGPTTDLPTTGTQDSSNILDLGVAGLPVSGSGGGARDIGVGDKPSLKLSAIWTVVFNGTTCQIQLSGAPDNGSGIPGSYTVMWTSPSYAAAALIAGAQMANVTLPRTIWEQVNPRFLKLTFITTGTNSTGLIAAEIVIDRDDQLIGATGAYSGYVPGITVPN